MRINLFLRVLILMVGLCAGYGPVAQAESGVTDNFRERLWADQSFALIYINIADSYLELLEKLAQLNTPEAAETKIYLEHLSSVARTSFLKNREQTRLRDCQKLMETINSALAIGFVDRSNSGGSPDFGELLRSGHLSKPPVCPSGGIYQWDGSLQRTGICCSVHGTLEHPNNLPSGADDPAWPSLDRLLAALRAFDRDGLCKPRGGLWLAFFAEPALRVLFDADCRPTQLPEHLQSLGVPVFPAPTASSANHLEFHLPLGLGKELSADLIFSTSSIFATIGKKQPHAQASAQLLTQSPVTAAESAPHAEIWLDFQQALRPEQEVVLAAELQFSQLGKDWLAAQTEKFPQGSIPEISRVTKVRFVLGKTTCVFACTTETAEDNEMLRQEMIKWHGLYMPIADKLIYDQMMLVHEAARWPYMQFRQWMKDTQVTADSDWVSICGRGAGEQAAFVPLVTGLVAAIAGPNLWRSHERTMESQCRANMRHLTAVMDAYRVKTGKPLAALDQKKLMQEGYTTQEVNCPQGGAYALGHSVDGLPSVACSQHGSLDH